MYISGDIYSFENRLHEFPTTTGDLVTGYSIEGTSYTGIDPFMTEKWNREYKLKILSLSSVITSGVFS